MKIQFIINPIAGKSNALKAESIIQNLNIKNHEISIVETEGPKHGTELAKKAVADHYDAVIAVGGDGTISEVMNGLIGTDIIFGIIPAGSGNDFSKALGIPKDIPKALDIILNNHMIKKIDVGQMDDKYFINVSGIGIDVEVLKHFMHIRKLFPGSLGYIFSVFKALITYNFDPIEIIIDGKPINRDVLLLSIGNGQYIGGGMKITPDAILDDGLFSVCIVDKMPRLKILSIFPSIFKGNHIKYPQVETFMAKEVIINTPDKTINCDGELLLNTPITMKIADAKLNFIFPKNQF